MTIMNSIPAQLPLPSDRPESAVVIYDGKCRFCRAQVERLCRWDRKGRLSFLSLHDPLAATLLPGISHEQMLEQMYVVEPGGRSYGGAAAFRYLTRRLPRLWLLAPLMHIPGTLPIWQWFYRQIALRRYQLGGKMGDTCDDTSCEIHFKRKH